MEQYPKVYLYKRSLQAKLFIDSHFHENLDVENIAREALFSKYHFIRLFKKIYGQTPHQYLTSVRIKEAMQLLQAGKGVSDVCFATGFQSLSSFSGLFKRMVGETPSAFLIRQKNIRTQIVAAPLRFIPHCFALKSGWIKNSNFKEVI